jgi:hypothetical protein
MITMELKEFVKETLLQVVQGVKEAQEAAKEYNAAINPLQYKHTTDTVGAKLDDKYHPVQNISFEVSLTSSSDEGNKSGIGVFLGSLSIGTSDTENNKRVSMTNIKFSVPVVLPADDKGNTKIPPSPSIAIIKEGGTNRHSY